MEVWEERRVTERRAADQRSGAGRRSEKRRSSGNRRNSAPGAKTDGDKFDRRGAYPSLFATLGFPVVRGVRRKGSPRRVALVRRCAVRRSVDRRVS